MSLTDVRLLSGWACRQLRDLLPLNDGPGRERAEERIRNMAVEIVSRAEEAEASSKQGATFGGLPGLPSWAIQAREVLAVTS